MNEQVHTNYTEKNFTNIRQFRHLRNYSQEYMAEKMGISQNAYSKIENEVTAVSVFHLKRIAEILNIPATDLLEEYSAVNHSFHIKVQSINKEDVLQMIDRLKEKLSLKKQQKHIFYPLLVMLLNTVDTAGETIP